MENMIVDANTKKLIFPRELTPILRNVLGIVCYRCAEAAEMYRKCGYIIETSAEDEQAFVLHRAIIHAIEHGAGWNKAMNDEIKAMLESKKAEQATTPSLA